MDEPLESNIVEIDTSAWPSSYYGRCKRVDLEKFFQKVQQEHAELERQQQNNNGRQVRFSTEAPQIFEYEAEYDTFDRLVSNIGQSKDIWPSYARRPPQRLDLRPIRNLQYNQHQANNISSESFINTSYFTCEHPPTRQSSSSSTSSSSSSSTTPSLPPLSPTEEDSSDEDEHPSPTSVSLSLPFSPTTLTRKLTSVFSRKKRS
ncbi:uncharacterized protein BX664DRAFT_387272 [Halteromyces radiatus]|uniref:uncharacterized protein n=1 Tax=Halteromyces radiatus TaxID=101107 RepID=UPI00221E696B|nr:uncharacterized protein BX664DRAFT_387272 [Halteromyces radiatus]KAI8084545.1 hypothetical protein BX664DRAFT_387272 [Halteromyces radiatus]